MTAEHLTGLRVMLEGQEGHSYADLLRVACTSEKLGIGGMFRSDHWLPIMGDRQIDATDAWATLAGLARDTTRIRFGALVSPMTFRHPSELAKQAATIDHMSGGRVEVGFGAGWYDGEHAAYGIPFPPLKERFDRLEESLEVCTRLWSSASSASFDGRYYKLDNAPGQPKPVQQPLPVIIGGRGAKRTPDLTARFAAEYNTGASIAEWSVRRARVVAACERIGRDPSSIVYSWMSATCVGFSEADAWKEAERRFSHARRTGDVRAWVAEQRANGMVFGGAEQAAETLSAALAAGASRWYLQIVPSPSDELLEMIATEIAPRIRA
jgi:F420-dependent oxidoreductase-like protein